MASRSYVRVNADRPGRTRRDQLDQEIELLSHVTDSLFRVPGLGWRFGLDPIVGLIPGIGDLATTLISLYILLTAVRYGVPRITLARMGLNVGIDLLIGAVPFFGDVFDAWWKTNQRNLRLLRQRVEVAGRRGADVTDWLFVAMVLVGLLAVLFVGFALVAWTVAQLVGLLLG
jgi:nitrate reductase NapE component